MRPSKQELLTENRKRNAEINAPYNPYTGQGSFTQPRTPISLKEYEGGIVWVPNQMLALPDETEAKLMSLILSLGSFAAVASYFIAHGFPTTAEDVAVEFVRIRIRYDFEFWAASFYWIKPKPGTKASEKSRGADVLFVLNRGQRKVLKDFYRQWNAGLPVRMIDLKARQWGCTTLIDALAEWIQLEHFHRWNSVICAHIKEVAGKITGMYKNALEKYPAFLRDDPTKPYKFNPYMGTKSTHIVTQRGCTVSIGSAESPNSLRSEDISIAHFTEVAFYKHSADSKAALDFVRAVTSSVPPIFGTMICYESTADGVGDFFYNAWVNAMKDEADNPDKPHDIPTFVAWFDIEYYSIDIDDYDKFIASMTDDEYRLFAYGATLEQINWYRWKYIDLKKDINRLHSEFPSNWYEAFLSTGRPYFPVEDCKRLERTCCPPMLTGELISNAVYGVEAMENVRFVNKPEGGRLKVWALPDSSVCMPSRYVVVVDVNRGVSAGADNGIICVFDRYWMAADPENGKPEVVAEWCGHEIMRYFAWTAVRVARFYNNAYLIIESNTPETTSAAGYQLDSVLDEIGGIYDNMFYRLGSPQDATQPPPKKYGFHTDRKTKPTFCEHHQVVLANDLYIERSLEAAIEHETFEYKENGSLGAANASHDDRLITRALGCYIILQKMDRPQIIDPEKHITTRQRIISESTF